MVEIDPRTGTDRQTYLRLNRDTGMVHIVVIRRDPATNVEEENDTLVLGHIDELKKTRKDLLPKIRGYRGSAEDTVPDPQDYAATTGELAEKLSTMKNPATIKAMAARDTRSSASALYTRRLEELATKADGAAGDDGEGDE